MSLRTTAFLAALTLPVTLSAAAPEPEMQRFAEPKKDWEWDEDKRFDFLMERLASLEASLDVVEAAIAKATGKKSTRTGEAKRAEANNSMMDRKGGAPIRWDQFYGTNAEKFFYHPVDPNTTYRTDTFLRQMGNTQDSKVQEGVPATQSVPVHQRPPQFDYIYRANRDAKERAEQEAIAIQDKLDVLNSRRIALEKEQAELWCKLAFRVIQRLNIPRKPLLRFRVVPASSSESDQQKAEALEAAAKFLSRAVLIIDKAENDQAAAFGNVKDIVSDARMDFDDTLLNADSVADDVQDRKTTLGKYVTLAQLLDDTSNNLSESYVVAMEGDQAQDRARKDRFRGLLQRSLVEYAQIILALDELTGVLKKDWKTTIDTKTRVTYDDVSWGASRVKVQEEPVREEQEFSEQDPVGFAPALRASRAGAAVGTPAPREQLVEKTVPQQVRPPKSSSKSGTKRQAQPRTGTREIDLLSNVNVTANAVRGAWTQNADGSIGFNSSAGSSVNGILEIPCTPPPEYDLVAEVEMTQGARHVVFYVASEGASRHIILKPSGGENISYASGATFAPEVGKPQVIEVQVRQQGITVTVDGQTLAATSFQRMTKNGYWSLRQDGHLGVGAHDTSLLVRDMRLRTPTGRSTSGR